MKYRSSNLTIIASEMIMFLFILVVIGLDEFIDLPHLLLGAVPKSSRIEEFLIEAGSVTVVAVLVLVGTVLQLRRIDRIERFLRVCAWCRKVWVGDRWIVFEEYIMREHMLKSTHSICSECTQKMIADIKEGSVQNRMTDFVAVCEATILNNSV
jgi:hypothetical protein